MPQKSDNDSQLEYVLHGNINIPVELKKILDWMKDCGNKNYEIILVGEKEKVNSYLREMCFTGKHPNFLTNDALQNVYPFLPNTIKNSMKRVNNLISNPNNEFNQTRLGIHTIGLLPKESKPALDKLSFGLTTWNGIRVY